MTCAVEGCGGPAVAAATSEDPENVALLEGTAENVVVLLCREHAAVGPPNGLRVRYFKSFIGTVARQGPEEEA